MLPWAELCDIIEPFYPKASAKGGHPTIGIERMLRIHFLQHGFELSDPGAEEVLYDSRAMRQFVGIDLASEPVPDEATTCKFRHLMERRNSGCELFRLVNAYLKEVLNESILDSSRSLVPDASLPRLGLRRAQPNQLSSPNALRPCRREHAR